MIIGYSISCRDYGGWMFKDNDERFPQCPRCHMYYGLPYDPDFRPRKKPYALVRTFERVPIASKDFREFCEKEKYTGIEFYPFNRTVESFCPKFTNTLDVDVTYREIKFDEYCQECQRYTNHWGVLPVFIKKDDAIIPDGFYRSDILIGNKCHYPLLIIGLETRDKLKAARMMGFRYTPIYQRSDFSHWREAPCPDLR